MGVFPTGAAQAPGTGDQANAVVSGQFTANNQTSAVLSVLGSFNVVIYGPSGPNAGWSATIALERSFDGGTTWITCGVGGTGTQAVYTGTGTANDVSIVVSEPELGVAYRLHCTAYTSGTPNYRMSTTSPAPTAWGIVH